MVNKTLVGEEQTTIQSSLELPPLPNAPLPSLPPSFLSLQDLLQNPDIAPGVVMLEEAGELLEAHTLTSLSPKTKQLIMVSCLVGSPVDASCWQLNQYT